MKIPMRIVSAYVKMRSPPDERNVQMEKDKSPVKWERSQWVRLSRINPRLITIAAISPAMKPATRPPIPKPRRFIIVY